MASLFNHGRTDFFYRYIYTKLYNLKLSIRAAGTPPLAINQGKFWRPRQIPSVIIRPVIFKLLLQKLKNINSYFSDLFHLCICGKSFNHGCTVFFYRYRYTKLYNLKLFIRAARTPPLAINQGKFWRPRQIPSAIIRSVIFRLLLQNLKASIPIVSDLFHLCNCGKYFQPLIHGFFL